MSDKWIIFLIQIGVIFIIYLIARVWMYFYFRRENNKMFDRSMMQIEEMKQRHERMMTRYYND